jgi:transposase
MAGMNFGYWVLYTDMEKNAFIALNDYRDRNFIEAGFDDLKGATDAKRLRVHRTRSVYGRIFVQFIAQVMRTWMRNRISSFNDEVRKYAVSPDGVLTRVRSYSKVSYIGRYKSQFTVMTKGQRLLFQAFGIDAQADSDEESDSEKLLS